MRVRIIAYRNRILSGEHFRKYADYHRCDAHMNELPVPCEPWEPWYKKKQSSYNKILVGGTLWFFFSFGMMIYTGSFDLNFSPPAQPGPPSDMGDECEEIET